MSGLFVRETSVNILKNTTQPIIPCEVWINLMTEDAPCVQIASLGTPVAIGEEGGRLARLELLADSIPKNFMPV